MNRFFFANISVLICGLVPVIVVNAQNITIKEINPTHSNSAGTTTGGRINQLGRATDRIFYAASEFGGLFKSTDAGRKWTRLDRHLPTRVSDVKVSPANPDLVIATSLYDGRVNSLAGINVSTDGGAHWSKPVSSNPPPGFCKDSANSSQPSAFAISFNPANPAHVFVGTNCGLARSLDSGLTWTFLNPSPDSLATNVYGVVVHHGGIIDTCGSSGHRRLMVGGQQWTGVQSGGVPLPSGTCSITASPDESFVLFATVRKKIFETDSGGDTWDKSYFNRAPQGRVPFVVTHNRSGRNFDLWFGDRSLFRAACKTPVTAGSQPRCPPAETWVKVSAGSHPDMGGIAFTEPPVIDVNLCRQECTRANTECENECQETFDSCMARAGTPGGPLKSQCVSAFANCSPKCTKAFNACNSVCNRPPKEGCPVVLATNGGTHFNELTVSPACQTPKWIQPFVTTRALWLWSMSGANVPLPLVGEALYMGTQDNGLFATLNADAGVPKWTRLKGGDVSDTVADANRIVYTQCDNCRQQKTRVMLRKAGSTSSSEIPNYPPGLIPRFLFAEVVARFGPNSYVVYSTPAPGRGNVSATTDITQNPIVWTQLGNFLGNGCGLWAAGPPTNPTFYLVSGPGIVCTDLISGFPHSGPISRYQGTSSTGTWQNVALPDSTDAGIFTVDPRNPQRLFVSQTSRFGVPIPGGAHMLRSNDGGVNWISDTVLDGLMTGNGAFKMDVTVAQHDRYLQPTLVAFDPNDRKTLVAGAADAGIFLSRDDGQTWTTVTNNSGDAANPVIPRPHWAYFDHECGKVSIYIGTQGRGTWRLSYQDPEAVTVGTCQARCENPFTDCQQKCAADRRDCLSEIGPDKLSECARRFETCSTSCANSRNACRQRCVACPQ